MSRTLFEYHHPSIGIRLEERDGWLRLHIVRDAEEEVHAILRVEEGLAERLVKLLYALSMAVAEGRDAEKTEDELVELVFEKAVIYAVGRELGQPAQTIHDEDDRLGGGEWGTAFDGNRYYYVRLPDAMSVPIGVVVEAGLEDAVIPLLAWHARTHRTVDRGNWVAKYTTPSTEVTVSF